MQREFEGSGAAFWIKLLIAFFIIKALLGSGLVWMLLIGGAIWYAVKSNNGICGSYKYHDGRKRKHHEEWEYEKPKNDEINYV